MGLIYSVSVLFFTFMIFRMYLKKDIRPYMTSRVVTLLTILGLLPYVNTVIIIATLGDAVVMTLIEYYRLLFVKASPENDKLQDSLEQELGREVVHKIIKRHTASEFKRKKAPIYISRELYE